MANVSRDDVVKLAALSNLQLADEEVDALTKDIVGILHYVEQLGELDTTGVEPTYQVTDLENVWRSDEIQQDSASPDDLLGLAPEMAEHQIKVPKVL
ncbi:Asp-tRNA(Asn)/Glu-tRNA(Gln) amidotransferase subunit GatC [Candidatus Saccharibacteria bacterium]|nr:Asp-tRNA(Asn)/Glu-tRNA(Gln) amidotransferase subunit GatC [Candidatus Saccharibacteria bacterium]